MVRLPTQTVTVDITGTDTPAVVWIATTTPGGTAGGLWSNPLNWETGTVPTATDDVIVITDQLHGLVPAFPATIDAPAFAKSVSMNDFGGPAPQLINQSTLTIAGVLDLRADSILDNSGTIAVGGLAEFSNQSVLVNSGNLNLAAGGDFKDTSSITNTGTIEVIGGTLNVQVNVTNFAALLTGTVKIDLGATATLNGGAITGGQVTNIGTLNLQNASSLKNGTLTNTGKVNVSGTGNTLDGETVSNTGAADAIDITGALTLKNATAVTNTDADQRRDGGERQFADAAGHLLDQRRQVTNKSGGTTTLQGSSTITGAAVGNAGTLNLQGTSSLKTGTLTNTSKVNVSGTEYARWRDGQQYRRGDAIDITGALTLKNITAVTNTTPTSGETVENGGSLTLQDTSSITGGQVTNAGTLNLEGTSFLKNGTLNNTAQVNAKGTNTLDNETVNNDLTGVIAVTGGLTLDHNTAITNVLATNAETIAAGALMTMLDTTSITGGKVDNKGTLTLNGSAVLLKNGALINTGTVNAQGVATLDGETVNNDLTGLIAVTGDLTLDHNTAITNVLATNAETIAAGASMTLLDTTSITGGKVDNKGTLTLNGSAVL